MLDVKSCNERGGALALQSRRGNGSPDVLIDYSDPMSRFTISGSIWRKTQFALVS
jgi:hypothetical protein